MPTIGRFGPGLEWAPVEAGPVPRRIFKIGSMLPMLGTPMSRSRDALAHQPSGAAVGRRGLINSTIRRYVLVQHASDVIAVVDAGGVLKYVSPSCLKVCGHAPEQLVGTSLAALLHPEDVPRAATFLGNAVSRRGSTSAVE